MSRRRAILHHPLSPIARRTLWAVLAVLVVMGIGTIGTKLLTGWRWVDSFYFMSMVATAEGPPNAPAEFWAKIFVAIMAFVSVGTLITALGTIFGPYLGYLFQKGVKFAEKELNEAEAAKKAKQKQSKDATKTSKERSN